MKLNQITLVLLCAICTHTVYAESQNPQNEVSEQILETITVRGKHLINEKGYKAERSNITGINTAILDTPYSIDVLTQKQLEDKRPTNLEEAIKNISGLHSGNNLAGTIDTVVRRGYGTNRDGSIMRNGVGSALARNLTANVQRVDVLKGPASTLYGMQDAGGVVNVVTKKPQHNSHKHSINGSVGNHGQRQIGLDTTAPIGDTGLAYRFIADYKNKKSWRSFGENTEYLIAPSLAWQNDTSKILAQYEYQNYLGDFDRGSFIDTVSGSLKPINVPLTARLDDPINQTDGYAHTFQLSGEHKFSPQWTAKAEYGFSKNHYHDWQARVVGYDPVKQTITQRVDSTDPSNLRIHNFNASIHGNFDQNDFISHKFRASVQLQDYKLALGDLKRSKQFAVPLAKLVDGSAYGSDKIVQNQTESTADARSSDMTEQYRTAALLLQDSLYLGDKWIVSGGLRLQQHKIHSGQGRGTQYYRNNDKGFSVLPQLGAVYLLNPNWSVYGNWGQSAKPNPSRSWDYKGAKIELEKTNQFEIGSKYNGDVLSANIALFQINKDHTAKRYRDPVSKEQVIRIAGKDRSRGVEIDVNGKITPKLEIAANYTLTDTKVKQNLADENEVGRPFDSVPKHMGGVSLNYDLGNLAGGKWRVGTGLDYHGKWGFLYGNQWVKMPSATTYHAFVSYDTKLGGKDLNVRLTGKNLGNKRHFVSHTTATMEHLQIAHPREIGLSMKMDF